MTIKLKNKLIIIGLITGISLTSCKNWDPYNNPIENSVKKFGNIVKKTKNSMKAQEKNNQERIQQNCGGQYSVVDSQGNCSCMYTADSSGFCQPLKYNGYNSW